MILLSRRLRRCNVLMTRRAAPGRLTGLSSSAAARSCLASDDGRMNFGQPTVADLEMMQLALGEARAGLQEGGVPVGAVLASGGQVLAAGRNERVQRGDPVAHGEIACLRNAGRRPSYQDTTVYTTLSPCPMCTGAILLFQIPRVVVGEAESFAGDLTFLAGRGVNVVLLSDPDCVAVMQEFQRRHPDVWSEDIGGR
jgi:cytosine deaminase